MEARFYFFGSQIQITVYHRQGRPGGRNLKQQVIYYPHEEQRAMTMPALSSLSLLLPSAGSLTRNGPTHSGGVFPVVLTERNITKKTPTDLPTGQSGLDSSLLKLSCQLILDCANLRELSQRQKHLPSCQYSHILPSKAFPQAHFSLQSITN